MPVSMPFNPMQMIILPQIVIVLGVIIIGLIYFLSQGKKFPAWFKGGLFAICIAVLLAFIFEVFVIDQLRVPGFAFWAVSIMTLPVFIFGIILGIISTYISKGSGTK